MGVHGMTTYVEGHRNLLKDVRFRDSLLVIDGSSLYYRLYFLHGLDQRHGGDYDAFTVLLTQFFSALADCNIQPYVVLDGGMDPSEKKFATLRQRLQSKIKEADKRLHGWTGSVLPLLTRRVFIQVLTQRGVPLVQCPAEADWDIACLARQWKCPVLTSDSDFYIFDLPGGYLPLQFFQWTNLSGKAGNRYVSARLYTASGLCQWFGSINCEILALSAVLLGNDYGSPAAADKIFAMLSGNGFGRGDRGGGGGGASSRIDGLLLWLFSFPSVAEALGDVSEIVGGGGSKGRKERNSAISSKLREAMQEYNINTQSSLARWFSEGGCAALGGQTSQLPECLSLAAAQGRLAPWVIDALVMHRVFLIAQVENSKLASSHSSSKAIRQALYATLLQRPQENLTQTDGGAAQQTQATTQRGRGGRGKGGRGQGHLMPTQQVAFNTEQAAGTGTAEAPGFSTPIVVEEYDRLDLNIKINRVEVLPTKNQMHLEKLVQAPVPVRLGILLGVLGAPESALAPVPLHLQLSVAVTVFWMQNATPKPSQLQLQALLLCMVCGELSRISQPGFIHHPYVEVNWPAEQRVRAVLDRQRVRPGERRGLDVAVVHSFSQWQACLWSTLCFNQLLLLPLPEPHLSCLFSGTLVHGLVRYLKEGRGAESLLAGGSLSSKLYTSLLDSVRNCIFKGHPPSSAPGRGRRGQGQERRGRGGRGRGGRGRGAQGPGRGVNELTNRFALLTTE